MTADPSTTGHRSLGVAVVTIATDRSLASDPAGEAIEAALAQAGHEVATREHVASDHDRVQSIVLRVIDRDDVDLVVTAGSTSVEPDDVTIEAVRPLLEKELTAFPELFTTQAWAAVGTRAIASRVLAGVAEETLIVCLPGNENAARTALRDLVLPEAAHLVGVARGGDAA